MDLKISDSTTARLNAIVQTTRFQRQFLRPPRDPMGELLRMAKEYTTSWRDSTMVACDPRTGDVGCLLLEGRLPPVLCVGEFMLHIMSTKGMPKVEFYRVLWFQDSFVPHVAPEVHDLLRRLATGAQV